MFKAERKMLPNWSPPHCIHRHLHNSYKLESCEGNIIKGTFSSRRLCAFIPREGTKLATEQKEFKDRQKAEGFSSEGEEEEMKEESENEEEGVREDSEPLDE